MNRFRHMIAALLVLAYTGQSLLVIGAPCLMSDASSGEVAQPMAGMDHSSHQAMASAAPGEESCCEGDFCSMSHCQSVTALPLGGGLHGVACAAMYRDAYLPLSPEHTVYSFFRPPISR